MKRSSIERIVRAIDPDNAPYIMQDPDTVEEFEWAAKYCRKGKAKMAAYSFRRAKNKVRNFKNWRLTPANLHIGDGVTVNLWSDRYAATVIKVTKNSVTVQRDKATLDPNFKPEIIPGGFAGHCINQNEQTYSYEPDPNGTIYKFHWSNKYCRYGRPGKLTLSKGRHEFYDYNF